jgi:uncharacterized protein YprB with RNaseH-like and TPR domain
VSSLADRLRGVVGRQSAVGSRQSSPEPSAQDLSCLRGEWRDGCFVVERRCEPSAVFGRDEVCVIGRRLAEASAEAALVARNDAVRPPFVFFDLETTGLAGGAGTCAFLVGCARFHEDGSFVVRQFLLVRQAEEPHLLALAARELGTGAIVSFNGKSFDVPLLELRHQFHRRPWAARGLPHLDLLYPARRVWRGRSTRSCRSNGGCSARGATATSRGSRFRRGISSS